MPFDRGPYIQTACLCETVIQEKTGVVSLIRLVDVLTHTAGGPNPPDTMPPVTFSCKLVIMLKAGEITGRHTLVIEPQLPSGETEVKIPISVQLEGDERGQNIITDLNFVYKYEGLYWFNIYFNDEKLTAIPFRVRYNRIITGPMQAS